MNIGSSAASVRIRQTLPVRQASPKHPDSAGRPAARDEDRDARRWRAVLARDERRDNEFVYAVESTGIFCRPSCPSRRPSAARVRFFSSPAEAAEAGYRPCRRCRPEAIESRGAALVEAARRRLRANGGEPPLTLNELARAAGASPFRLRRALQRATGLTPRQIQEVQGMEILKRQLAAGAAVSSAVYAAGFGSPSRVYEKSRRHLAMTPGAYRRGGAGESVRFTTFSSAFGAVLLAATPIGVCALKLGARASELEAELRRELARAEIQRDDSGLDRWAEAVRRALRGLPFDSPPLAPAGTDFQRRVWELLLAIPRGETRGYGELARTLGQPRAARAVAAACAANSVAVLIPCHRVVGAQGALTGYRWGVARKAALLAEEAKSAVKPAAALHPKESGDSRVASLRRPRAKAPARRASR